MKDIANHTGLGLATISSYFNGGNVREKNRIKIEAAIEELHYEINEVARGLKTNETKLIGLVIPELSNIFSAEVIAGVEDVLRNHGYATLICDCRSNKDLEKKGIDFFQRKRVDGIINMPLDGTGAHLKSFLKTGKPVVLFDRKIPGLGCDCVYVDNRKAAREAVSHLIKKGHRSIGILCGPDDVYTSSHRLEGYCQAMKEAGLPIQESLICYGGYTIQGGLEAIRSLLEKNPEMTAVFGANNDMTIGALISANEMRISIPDQLSVIGFDYKDFARAYQPFLTIVTQPTGQIAEETARIMLKRLGISDEELGLDEETAKEYDLSGPIEKMLYTEMMYGKSVKDRKEYK